MKLYLISDEQLGAILHGSAHEREGAVKTVTEQEVTVERVLGVLGAQCLVERDRTKGGSE